MSTIAKIFKIFDLPTGNRKFFKNFYGNHDSKADWMRRFNAVITVLILVLFLIHAFLGAFMMMDVTANTYKITARACATLTIIHALIGLWLTGKSLWICHKTGAPYFKENQLYWARRISGLLIMVLIFFHSGSFTDHIGGIFQLKPFNTARLIIQILFILSLALHIISNVRPMLISLGIKKLRPHQGKILFILSVILLFFTAAFIIYYLHWQSM